MRSLNVALLVLALTASSFAAVPHLSMPADEGGDAITLDALQVKVTIRGHLARTDYDLTFRSALNHDAGGDFVVPIPANGEVSDLGLYFNGTLRHAVAVDRLVAQHAYGDVVHRRRVDPVLADRVSGRAFRMRLYPIPAFGLKQVHFACDEELLGTDYLLDLGFKQTIGSYSIVIDAPNRRVTLIGITLRPDGATWIAQGSHQVLEAKIRVSKDDSGDALAQWSAKDQTWYVSAPVSAGAESPAWPPTPHVTLLWDASGSAVQQDAARLRAFFDAFFAKQLAWTAVTILPFHVRVDDPRYASPHDLARTLDDIDAAGATNLTAALERIPEIADHLPQSRIVLVTDGINSATDSIALRNAAAAIHKPITIVNASQRADDEFLASLAGTTGGVYLDLTHMSPQAAAQRAMLRPVRRNVVAPQLSEVMPLTLTADGVVAGKSATPPASVTINGREIPVRTIEAGDLVRRAWARARLRQLLDRGAPPDEVAALGRAETMLTPRTSLIVLERAQDYDAYGIPRPDDLASLPSTAPSFVRIPSGQKWFMKIQVLAKDGSALPGTTVTLATESGSWSAVTDAEGLCWIGLAAVPTRVNLRAELAGYGSTTRVVPNLASGQFITLFLNPAVSESITVTAEAPLVDDRGTETEVAMSPRGLLRTVASSEYESASLERRHAIADDVVLRIASERSVADRFREYAAARATVGGDRLLHIRAAELLRDQDPELALRVLTDLVESDPDDAALVRIIARIADGWGEPDVARQLLMRAMEDAPDQPQTVREILLRTPRLRRAAEEAALRERFPAALRSSHLRIGADAETEVEGDITVDALWDSDFSDVDVHVIEPGGEEVWYNHTRSAAGGRLHDDITTGFGPEVYDIAHARRGEYKIQLEYFAGDATEVTRETLVHVIVTAHGKRSDHMLLLSRDKERRTVTTVRWSGR